MIAAKRRNGVLYEALAGELGLAQIWHTQCAKTCP